MYKLILVDDETLLLESMASAFEWEKYGFSLAGTFLNAESAIAYMKENPVDVIISDIKMPGMNGVRFAAYVYNNYPDTAFVIISGYESFEYAKEAMGYNVREYLLKPLSYDNITETLKKIRCDLEPEIRYGRQCRKPGSNFKIFAEKRKQHKRSRGNDGEPRV